MQKKRPSDSSEEGTNRICDYTLEIKEKKESKMRPKFLAQENDDALPTGKIKRTVLGKENYESNSDILNHNKEKKSEIVGRKVELKF